MLVDFHTHIFPDKIAEKTVEFLENQIYSQQGEYSKAVGKATVDGLVRNMKNTGVTNSVVMPIATKVTQSTSINNFAEEITGGSIISFGSVHPLQEDWEQVIEDLSERGFKGIKLHPEYQQFYIDSEESIRVLKKCQDKNLLVTIHAGKDVGVAPPVHCTPDMLLNVLKKLDGGNIIAAHMGGFWLWDEVLEKLCTTNLLFDTAVVSSFIDRDIYRKIIEKHGADKILFASDYPWENPADSLSFLKSLDLPKEDFEKITYKNAKRLLNI
ncbi:MAG: amidohydrolase family protein [Acutalibacteraceae bacterium]